MAPSSSDMLSPEFANSAMDFQPTSFPSNPQSDQQQLHQPPHPPSQAQVPPQSYHTTSYQSVQQQSQHAFGSDGPQQQQYPLPQQHPPPFQPHQQLNDDSYQPQHAFDGDLSSQRQQVPNGDEQQQQQQQQQQQRQHPFHNQRDSFASMTNPLPPASTSGSSSQAAPSQHPSDHNPQPGVDPQFDIFEWYPKHQSCQRYFASHAQHSAPVQAVAAFINIALPFQRASNPIPGTTPRTSPPSLAPTPTPPPPPSQSPTSISLIPYIRRLVITGLDFPGVLHGFFGDDWTQGIGPLHEQERRNYLFAAKSGGWASVKKDYDMLPLETVPFLRPLQGCVVAEIEAAERTWSEWLAMEDWMVGPRAPEGMVGGVGGGLGAGTGLRGGGREGGGGHERDEGRR